MKNFTSQNIIATVADVYGISIDDFYSRSRKRTLVDARSMAAYIMKQKMPVGPVFIGSELCLNHATVCYGIKRVKTLMEVDKTVREKYNQIIDKL